LLLQNNVMLWTSHPIRLHLPFLDGGHSGRCSALTSLPNRTSAEPGVWAMTTGHDTNDP
jgi:hypothetical protein